jgi:predicted DNA-binding transcriptional regulator
MHIYAHGILEKPMKGAVTGYMRSFASEVTRGLGIPKACARIIEVVAIQGRRLSFHEIAGRAKISERSLRSHIAILVRKGILLREVAVTRTRRLAYCYHIAPLGDIMRLVRNELAGRMERLRRLAGEVGKGSKALRPFSFSSAA